MSTLMLFSILKFCVYAYVLHYVELYACFFFIGKIIFDLLDY